MKLKLYCKLSFDSYNYIADDAILDTAAETNLISQQLLNNIGIPISGSSSLLRGIGNVSSKSMGEVMIVVNGMNVRFMVDEISSGSDQFLLAGPL